MGLSRYVKGALAGGALVAMAGTASAASVTSVIDLGGSGGYSSSFSFTDGTVGLTTTGHKLHSDGSIGDQKTMGQWGGGLGVKSDRWDQHFVDSNGADEVVKFLFDTAVKIEKIWFTYVDCYDDFAFSVFSPGGSVTHFDSDLDIDENGYGYGSYTFASGYVSTMFGIGAAGHGDSFKIRKIQFSYDDDPAPVPLPAAGWLMLAGLGGLAAVRRVRRG